MIQSFRLNVFLGVLACMLIFALATRIMVRQVSEGPILLYLYETLSKHIDNEIEELKQSPQNKIDVASQVQIVQYNLGKSFADLKPNELQVWMAGGPSQDQKQLAALIENANWRDLNFAIEKPSMTLAEVSFQGETWSVLRASGLQEDLFVAVNKNLLLRSVSTIMRNREAVIQNLWPILIVFAFGIMGINKVLPAGFIPNEDQGQIYAIIQTPPGTTLERTNEISKKLQMIAKKIEGVSSVTSLAGYEILTEGRGSNAGTCLINLKDWSDRKQNVKEIILELEEKSKDLPANIEYFEPPAVPGYGTSDGFSLRLLDKGSDVDYQEFDKVNTVFVEALKKRKELSGLFAFYSAKYPQYELFIDNNLAMQKGVSIGEAMENLNIMVGSTYEQGFIRFNNYYKVYTQAAPEFRKQPSDILNMFIKDIS